MAIYGDLEASPLLWKKFNKSPEEMGYQKSEYDWCVMNKLSKVNSARQSVMLMT